MDKRTNTHRQVGKKRDERTNGQTHRGKKGDITTIHHTNGKLFSKVGYLIGVFSLNIGHYRDLRKKLSQTTYVGYRARIKKIFELGQVRFSIKSCFKKMLQITV